MAENLIPTLKRLGWEQPKAQVNQSNYERLPQNHHMLLTTVNENGDEESPEIITDETQGEAHDDILCEVYQVMQK